MLDYAKIFGRRSANQQPVVKQQDGLDYAKIFAKRSPNGKDYVATGNDTSDYETYSQKLLAKEGGGKWNLFTGGEAVEGLTKMTVQQVLNLQKGRKNTAIGAFQFTRDTLIDTAKAAGISLSDRFDENTQRKLFTIFTKENETYAKRQLGINRALTDGERYALHFLGRSGGTRFLKAKQENASARFADLFGKEYARNANMFAKRGGDNVTLDGAFAELVHRMK